MKLPDTAPLAMPGGSSSITCYGYAIYVLDVTLLLYAYFEEIYDPSELDISTMVEVDLTRRYDRFRLHVMIRSGLLAICQGHLAFLGAKLRNWRRSRLAGPVLLLMALIVGSAAAVYTLLLAGVLDNELGCSFPTIMLSPMTMACCVKDQGGPLEEGILQTVNLEYGLDVAAEDGSCERLDREPGIFKTVRDDAAYGLTWENAMELAWGHYPPLGYHMGATVTNFMRLCPTCFMPPDEPQPTENTSGLAEGS